MTHDSIFTDQIVHGPHPTEVVSSSVSVVVLFCGFMPCQHKRAVQQRWGESLWPGPSWNRSITRKPKSRQVTKFYFVIIEQLLNFNLRKEKTKKRKKTSRNERVFANVHRNESNLLSPIRETRFHMQVIFFFFQFLIRPGSCRVRSLSVWGVCLFRLQFTREEWWLNFRGSIFMQ